MLTLWLITLALGGVGFLLRTHVRSLVPPGACTSSPRVSVIIPARNEEHNLPTLLRSLRAQRIQPHEILVVDDGSTDGTAEQARRLGAKVIGSSALPEGWHGKPWACHQGAQVATGDLLLFLDADTWFETDGLMNLLSAYPGGAFSVGPYHAVRRPYESLSLFFNLNMVMGTVPHRLFGQLLLVDRDSYRRAGGHEAVRDRILENFHLADRFRTEGIPVQSATGRGSFCFRMYPNGLGELMEGWVKGFASGAAGTAVGSLVAIVVWMAGLVMAPTGGLLTGNWLAWGALYLLFALQVGWFSRQVGAFRWFAALLYPLPLVFFFVVFSVSLARSGKAVRWKGRAIRAH